MKKLSKLFIAMIAFTLMSFSSSAQEIAGSWKGAITTQGMEVDLIFNISESESGLTSTLDVPMQGATDLPLESTTLEGNKLTIASEKMKLSFTGEVSGEEINGTYSQMGKDFPLVLKKTVKTLPGNTSLPSSAEALAKVANAETGTFKYSVEDFYQTPKASSFKLSPNGKYISYLKRGETSKRTLYIKEITTEKETAVATEGEDLFKGYFWASNDRFLFLQDKGGNENFHVFGVNLDGSNKKELTPYDGVKVNVLAVMRDKKDHIIIQMNKDNEQFEEPYKLNINTGAIEKLYTVEEGKDPIAAYDFDRDGNLRGLTRIANGVETEVFYKIDGEFKSLMQLEMGTGFGVMHYNYATKNPHDAYVASNVGSDKMGIFLYDMKANKVIKKVFEHKIFDVSDIRLSKKRNYELDYIMYNGEKMTALPMSATYKKINARLKMEFGDKEFYTTYNSEDENLHLIVVTSDKIVAEYYTYDVKKDEVKLLYKILPQLKEEDMAVMRPIKFKSRDGLTIYGYITLPKAALDGKKIPMIVMPHGGPQGVRDSWGFNPENQLFASRGYATLNINFRISGGYGKEFMTAGFKQIGRKAMDDVEDGIAYVLKQGWINENKIAIFGASHGGYAVLRGMTKTPDLYACGADYVGVSNLNTFMNTIPAYWEKYREFLHKSWYNPNIPEEKAIMDEISPALHTDLIKKPLFVIQGANDPRVNIDEADQIVEKLRARNIDVPYMVKYDEGHGFYKEENRIEMYKTLMGFFAMHLK